MDPGLTQSNNLFFFLLYHKIKNIENTSFCFGHLLISFFFLTIQIKKQVQQEKLEKLNPPFEHVKVIQPVQLVKQIQLILHIYWLAPLASNKIFEKKEKKSFCWLFFICIACAHTDKKVWASCWRPSPFMFMVSRRKEV